MHFPTSHKGQHFEIQMQVQLSTKMRCLCSLTFMMEITLNSACQIIFQFHISSIFSSNYDHPPKGFTTTHPPILFIQIHDNKQNQ